MNVHVEPMGQPTPGSARPGNLYADLQSRSLWLGVSLDVDSSGSVLISDMMQLMDDIAEAESDANAYTRTALFGNSGAITLDPNGYAGRIHGHTSSEISDFHGAVTTIIAGTPGLSFNRGTVLMFSGDPTLIGTGDWVGWALCNGLGGTPNLTDRFVMGYSGLPGHGVGDHNDPTTAATSLHNGHTHVGGPVTLTLAQIPSHQHGPGSGSTALKGIATGSITPGGTHNHYITMTSAALAGGVYRPMLQQAGNAINVFTETEPNHGHGITTLDILVNAGLSSPAGSSQSHAHTVNFDGAHSHTIATAQLREAIPFYALAFVIKL